MFARKIKKSLAPAQTPLVNLFAYIRDLFTTTRPRLRYDDSDSHFWLLEEISNLAALSATTTLVSCQWNDPTLPLIQLQRGESLAAPSVPAELLDWLSIGEAEGKLPEILPVQKKTVAFESNPERIAAFREFSKRINGKSLDEVQNLTVPAILDAWVEIGVEEGLVQANHKETIEERLQDDEHRYQLFLSYSRSFRKFQESAAGTLKINRIYDEIHDLFYSLKAQPDRQISLSFGLISGNIGGENYRNFLFHIPLKLILEKQTLTLEADTLAHVISCEQSFSDLLESHFSHESEEMIRERKLKVLREVDNFNTESREFNFEPDYLRGTYYQTAVKIAEVFPRVKDIFFLENELMFGLPDFENPGEITLSFSPTIQVRELASGVQIAHDADNIIAKINELGSKGENGAIPDFFKKLFSLRKPGNPLRIAYRTENKEIAQESISEELPERFLFPLPYNDEQLSIAEQLLKQDAVTVQGPPGTGKSHTIANLASHFVAEGKSILIVSKNAKALEVIKGKLPEAIRNLAVAFLDGTKNQEELKHAIDAIKNQLSSHFDPAEITRLEDELAQLEATYHSLREKVFTQINQNQRLLKIYDPAKNHEVEATASVWAERWEKLDREELLITDEIHYQQNTESWAEMLMDWLRQRENISDSEAEIVLPDSEILPDLEKAEMVLEEWNKFTGKIEIADYQEVNVEYLDDDFLALIPETRRAGEKVMKHREVIERQGTSLQTLEDIWNEYRPLAEEIEAENRRLLGIAVDLGERSQVDPDELLEALSVLLEKYGRNDRLSILQKKLLSQTQKSLFHIKLNGRSVQGPEDLRKVQDRLRLMSRNKQLGIVLNHVVGGVDAGNALSVFHHWEEILFHISELRAFNSRLISRGLEPVDFLRDKAVSAWEFLSGLTVWRRQMELEAIWQEMIAPILTFAHPAVENLVSRWQMKNLTGIEMALKDIASARERQTQGQQLRELEDQLNILMPITMESIRRETPFTRTKHEIETDIFARKLESFLLETISELGDPNLQLAELQSIRKEKELLISDLVAEKAWQNKQSSVTDEQKASLSAWRNDLINIGKGHGKNTKQNMASAVRNMQLARDVVPIWIMQQQTAISFFPDPQPGQFDLLIVDEASQCDISMLNLIFRCKKCIVVGDENQTSVATLASQFPLARTNQLLDRYLTDHPFKQQFNINNRSTSIYTLSGVIYPNIISLREHFRCRPELIGFSNQFVYDSHIIPLRTAADNPYGKAMEVHYIEDDPNDVKKPSIVKSAVQLISGLIEDVAAGHLSALPTVGILCLDSSNEAHRELLIRELGRHPLIKSYADELELLVGTSREFQGDERDIMLLTTTASHKFTVEGKIRPPRAVLGEDMMRIYNVATSRARDKAILLHSIHPEAVARMNPECFRKRLIDYFTADGTPESPVMISARKDMHPATGDCGRELYRWMTENDWEDYLNPQFRIGPYQIDLAVIRGGKKLAIFIDGVEENQAERLEKSIHQQMVLERAGWKCMRVQALQWQCSRGEIKNALSEWMM